MGIAMGNKCDSFFMTCSFVHMRHTYRASDIPCIQMISSLFNKKSDISLVTMLNAPMPNEVEINITTDTGKSDSNSYHDLHLTVDDEGRVMI